jgi:hypothetical protein
MDKEKHLGSEARRRAFPALVAVLIVALLAAGTWTTAAVSGDGTAAPDIPGTGQTGRKNSTPDDGDLPAARPHPRGLPRHRARPHERPQESREPGPLITETDGHQALTGMGLISVIGAGLRSLLHPRSPKSTVEDTAGSEGARGAGQDTAATQRFPMDAGITRGFTLPLGGTEDQGRRR